MKFSYIQWDGDDGNTRWQIACKAQSLLVKSEWHNEVIMDILGTWEKFRPIGPVAFCVSILFFFAFVVVSTSCQIVWRKQGNLGPCFNFCCRFPKHIVLVLIIIIVFALHIPLVDCVVVVVILIVFAFDILAVHCCWLLFLLLSSTLNKTRWNRGELGPHTSLLMLLLLLFLWLFLMLLLWLSLLFSYQALWTEPAGTGESWAHMSLSAVLGGR